MTTTITQIADERRLYEVIEQRHRESLIREQIRIARANQPSSVDLFLSRTRMAIREITSRKPGTPPVPYEAIPESLHDSAGSGPAKRPAGVVVGQ